MTGRTGMLPPGDFNFDGQDVMDIGEPAPTKPTKPRRRQADQGLPPKRIEDYEWWTALVWKDGRPVLRYSPNMKGYKDMVMRPEAEEKFAHVMRDFIGPARSQTSGKLPPSNVLLNPRVEQLHAYSRKSTKRRHPSMMEPFDQRQVFLPEPQLDSGRQPGRGERKVPLKVKDSAAQREWFGEAFKAVQQVGCRTIAKVWIKKIHPKKQSTHPYNGGLPRDVTPDPHRTRPPYWPEDVIHKEPDHIDRSARTSLLVHLIMQTPQQQLKASHDDGALIYAVDLLHALEEKKGDFKEDRWAIIQDIISVREQLERFNDNSRYCDPSTVIYVTDFSEPSRAKNDADGEEDDKEDATDEQTAGISASSVNTTAAPSPEDPLRHVVQQSVNDQDIKPVVSEQRSARRLAQLENEARLAASRSEFDMAHEFLAMTSNQGQRGMSVNNGPYPGQSISGMSSRLGRPQIRQTMALNPPMNARQQQDVALHDWMAANDSPAEILPVEYTFNGVPCQPQISSQSYHMDEAALANNNREMMGGGVPILESMPYHSFPDHSRSLQHRAMSASHGAMLGPSIHDSHDIHYFG